MDLLPRYLHRRRLWVAGGGRKVGGQYAEYVQECGKRVESTFNERASSLSVLFIGMAFQRAMD